MSYKVEVKLKSNNTMLENWDNPELHIEREKENLQGGKKRAVKDQEYYERLANLWKRTCFFDPEIGPFLPSDYIEANLVEAGKKLPLGHGSMKETVTRNVTVNDYPEKVPLIVKKKIRSIEDFERVGWLDVRVGNRNGSSILLKRVRIPEWEMTFTLLIADESELSMNNLKKLYEIAATLGFGDWRPKFGTYDVVSIRRL